MNEEELAAWEASAAYWVDPRVPMFGGLDRRNVRKQAKRVLALIAEVRRLKKREGKLLDELVGWESSTHGGVSDG